MKHSSGNMGKGRAIAISIHGLSIGDLIKVGIILVLIALGALLVTSGNMTRVLGLTI